MSNLAEGRCLCGAVQYKIEGEPLWAGHCHCASCRRNTGSAIATFAGFRPRQVSFTAAARRFYESSPGARRGFCEKCGTPMSYEAVKYPNEIHMYVGTLDDPELFAPTFHVFYSERINWFDTADDLPRHHGKFTKD